MHGMIVQCFYMRFICAIFVPRSCLCAPPPLTPPHPIPTLSPLLCSSNRTDCAILLLQTLLDDIMAMTRADSEAGSSDSSQTQQRDLPGDVNADSSSNQAQSAPASHVSPSLRDEESAAQHESLQDHVGAHHQGCLVLQAASVPGEIGLR